MAAAPGHKKLIQTPADLDAALRKAGVGDVAAREMRIRYGIPIDSEAPLDAKGALGASDDVQRQVAAELAARTHNAKVGMAERGLTMARGQYGQGARVGQDAAGQAIREQAGE
ncbi:MAG: hypothetical protein A2848_02350 [Candidatus Magasanikbacteria bacterium RIFCSPHIGHO2_01_FULL_50_8]|uniref:Uncharacterized protein n=1 Tax=Candidatus Magasanikbacteria bacterium RIFCSPHIGHO2_01_FULL_50_8 TaxID=1798674 RepID=A0A1F6LRG8_9BACT|nr:MAG: hypothetical protein A2848_02350 [Candidatus Magasanikbacteria bacterium RIFCSPHIGHO2_01_FULL_50_8]